MPKLVRLLLVSDSNDGPRIISRDLARGDWNADVVRVADGARLAALLSEASSTWDVVLADKAAALDPHRALGVVRTASETVPVVVVHYCPEERTYVDAVPSGIDPSASRLARALDQALHERALRRERHELRAQLVVAERLAAVGFLVAGVAHEINNPLSAVIANHEFLRGELTRFSQLGNDVTEATDALNDIAYGAAVIRQVVRDLRAFSRNDPLEGAIEIDPRTVLEGAVRMTWHEARGRAQLIRDFHETPLVMANEARLSQVFLNLLINAAHAIRPGKPAENEIRVVASTNERGQFVAEVHDTGCGIAADHLPYVFDAYFTTKPPGSGSGLGLAVSHRIIASLGGEMTAESVEGKGSVFRVVLPAHKGES